MDTEADPPTRFIILKADMTGDLWHVAAACALWPICKSQERFGQGSFAFSTWTPRPAIIVWNDMPGETAKAGETAFAYLQSISLYLKPIVVMISKEDQRFLDTLNHQYIDAVAKAFDDDDQPNEWTRGVAIAEGKFPPSNRKGKGPRNDKFLVPLAATTAMVMQMMDYLGVPTALKRLGTALSDGLEEQVKTDVQKVVSALAVYIRNNMAARVVLLNYRKGQVNTQHDTNEQIKNSLKTKVIQLATRTAVVSIPQMPKEKWRVGILEGKNVPSGLKRDLVFDLYRLVDRTSPPLPNDRRAKVWFWKLVAEQLQIDSAVAEANPAAKLIGMIGGRSGSLDLPSFVGVRCMSWDQPILAKDLGVPLSTEEEKNIREQASQMLRLLNQWPLMSMAYMRPDSFSRDLIWDDDKIQEWLQMSPPPEDHRGRALRALPDGDMAIMSRNLLNGMGKDPTGKTFRSRMERPELGIVATHLDVLSNALDGGGSGGGGGTGGDDPSVP